MGTQCELNVIKVGDKEFLLTGSNGAAVHLTGEARSGDVGRTPFHGWRLDPKRAEGKVLQLFPNRGLTTGSRSSSSLSPTPSLSTGLLKSSEFRATTRPRFVGKSGRRCGSGLVTEWKTYAHENMVVFVCRPIYDQHAEEFARMAPRP